MNNLLKIAILPVLVAAFSFVSVQSVDAQQSCENVVISNTGPGSINEITCEGTYTITIECKNDTLIVIGVDQSAESGTATVTDNTTGGSAKSGDAVNINEIDALIENNNCLEDEDEEEVVVVTPDVETPTTPAPAVLGEVKAATTPVAVLPSTGVLTPMFVTILATLGFAVSVVVAKTAVYFFKKN